MTVDIHTPSKPPPPKRRSDNLPSYFRPLKNDLRWAGVITAAILVLMVVGLPGLGKPDMELQNPVIIDLVDLKDVKMGPVTTAQNTTQKVAPPKPEIRKEVPVEPPKPAKTDVKPPEQPPEKPPEKSVEAPTPPPEDAISLKPKKDKPPEKPKDERPKKPKVEKPEKKPDPKQQADFSSMLKNLVGDEAPTPPPQDAPAADKPVDTAKPTAVAPVYGETLTLSEMDALRRQLAGCWNVPTGAMDAENLIVDIQVVVRQDRTVQSATVIDQSRYNSDSFFRAAADSARRAVLNPSCSPLLLPPEQYDTWKNMVVRFNPREMFGGL